MFLPDFWTYADRIGYERRWIATVLGIQLGAVIFEGIGISMVLPILEFMNAGSDIESLASESRLWRGLVTVFGYIGVEVSLVALLVTSFVAILARQGFVYWREVYTSQVRYELMRRVRDLGFKRFLQAGLSYHDRVRAGDFINELTTELLQGVAAMNSGAKFLGFLVLMCGYLVVVLALSPILTLIAVSVLSFAAYLLNRLTKHIRRLGISVTDANQEMSSFLVERLKSVRLVRLSGVEEAEQAALSERTLEQRDRTMEQRKLIALLGVLVEPVVLAISFVLLYFSVTSLSLDFEVILLFFFILLRLVPIAREGILTRQGYISNLASIEVLDARMRGLQRYKDPVGGTRELTELNDGITLEDVSFRYDTAGGEEAAPALDGINLKIPAHKMTALVGPSGAGKSTLVDLLPRLREVSEGTIRFDDIAQNEFSTASLRQAISFAPQTPQIFNVTVAEHIRYGHPGASLEDIAAAARLAQAQEFIERLADGYDTKLGENGARLSGGQRQRLDLARALVRRAPILILDEPTANLDAESEAFFREALTAIQKETDTTIIIIGHRLSTVSGADQIVVMMEGRVAECGTHEELMNSGGWYEKAYGFQHTAPPPAAAKA